MKKWFYATVVLTFISSPVYAYELKALQEKTLNNIQVQMEQHKDDPAKINLLTEQKKCVEKAADSDAVKACLAIFPLEPAKFLEK